MTNVWENALLRTSSRKELLERNPCWSCSTQSSASLLLDLLLHSPPSIDTSPTFKHVGESRRGIWFWTSTIPGTVRSMWRTTVRGLFALLGQQPWHQQHQQQQQHLLGAGILVTALTQMLLAGTPPSLSVQPLVQLVNLFHLLTTLWIACCSCLSTCFILSSLFHPSLSSSSLDSLLDLLFFVHSRSYLFYRSRTILTFLTILDLLLLSQLRHKLIFFSFFVQDYY